MILYLTQKLKPQTPNQSLEPTTIAVTECAPSRTFRASYGRGSSCTFGKKMFYLPLAALIAISLIYRNELGLKSVAIYWTIWIIALGVVVALKLSPFIFVAFQAFLAAIMYIHVKKNQAF